MQQPTYDATEYSDHSGVVEISVRNEVDEFIGKFKFPVMAIPQIGDRVLLNLEFPAQRVTDRQIPAYPEEMIIWVKVIDPPLEGASQWEEMFCVDGAYIDGYYDVGHWRTRFNQETLLLIEEERVYSSDSQVWKVIKTHTTKSRREAMGLAAYLEEQRTDLVKQKEAEYRRFVDDLGDLPDL